MKIHRLSQLTSAVVLALGLTTSVMAADTASNIRGTIFGPQSKAAINTKVTVIHEPTGTRRTYTTNDSGTFVAVGLRVGGPYKILVDSDEFQDTELDNVYLSLGQTSQFNFQLKADDIEVIQVTGNSRHAIVYGEKNGIGSVYGTDDIDRSPAFDRDLKDVLRQNPLVNISDDDNGEMSVGGVNPRFNSISIDGIKQNDDFGLNSNGYPTNGSPVSLISIEQLSIDVTPFNAKASGFTGASVNAVTKSGTNKLTGEFFYDYSSDSLAGKPKNEDGEEVELEFERKTFGAAVGGALIQDQLFFFASYEQSENPFVNDFGPAGSGAANEKDWLTIDTINEVKKIALDEYGFDAGDLGKNLSNDSEKLIIKLDWNINDDHRAAFTYQSTDDNSVRPQHNSRSSEFSLLSNWYNVAAELDAYALQLYSDWTDEFSTQLKISYKDTANQQRSYSDDLNSDLIGQACIKIEGSSSCSRSDSLWIGADPYRHANILTNDTFSVDLEGDYLIDNHQLSFGIGLDKLDVFNQFVPFSRGDWAFNSVEDFRNHNAASVSYSNAYTGDASDAAATFTVKNFHVFIEDKWEVNSELWMNAGVRYERISTSGLIRENQTFKDLYGMSNTASLDGKNIILPRFGFNWSIEDNLTLSGGLGRYYGGTPNVWISNSYSNDGQINVRADVDNVDLTNAELSKPPVGAILASGNGDVNAIDPSFKLPSEWRVGLTLNYTADFGEFLGNQWNLETSYMYVKEKDAVRWKELYRETKEIVVGPDGRNIYVGIEPDNRYDRYDILLTNGEGGKRKIFTLSTSKAFENGVYFSASYANTNSTSLVGGTNSTATSNYSKYNTADRNNPIVGTSRYEVEHSFKLNLSYNTELIEGYRSGFSLQGERSSGRPYSWVFADSFDYFGGQHKFDDGSFLAYIPSGADDAAVTYADGFSYEQLQSLLKENGLEKYAGGIMPKNTENGPWNTRLDFKFSQEIPGFFGEHKGMFFVSVKNVLNLIDSSAGKIRNTNFYNTRDLVQAEYDKGTGKYILSNNYSDRAPAYFDSERSAWRIKVGVSYKF